MPSLQSIVWNLLVSQRRSRYTPLTYAFTLSAANSLYRYDAVTGERYITGQLFIINRLLPYKQLRH